MFTGKKIVIGQVLDIAVVVIARACQFLLSSMVKVLNVFVVASFPLPPFPVININCLSFVTRIARS